jgi:DNA-binding NtrC family response regulator
LEKYPWPGNVRELEHLIQRVITLEEGDTVLPEHLPEEFQPAKKKKAKPPEISA